MRKLNNGFWYAHEKLGSKSKLVHATAASIPEEVGMFDVVTLGAVLLHLRDPIGALERALGRLVRLGDRWFQIERLYRFNAKFEPHWQPRYLLFDRPLALPRVALAAMWAEGHLPKPRPLRIRPSAATARVAPARGTPSHP